MCKPLESVREEIATTFSRLRGQNVIAVPHVVNMPTGTVILWRTWHGSRNVSTAEIVGRFFTPISSSDNTVRTPVNSSTTEKGNTNEDL